MKNLNQKLLILLMITAMSGLKSYADTNAELMLQTSIPAAVSFTKQASSVESGKINQLTGTHGGLQSVFTLQTNATDDDLDFILSSSVLVDGGTASAFGKNGTTIVLTNTNDLPETTDVNNAKTGGSSNHNVIAYPFSITTTNGLTKEYKTSLQGYENCYAIILNTAETGNVIGTVGTTPDGGTYNVGQDAPGTYQATVTITAVGK